MQHVGLYYCLILGSPLTYFTLFWPLRCPDFISDDSFQQSAAYSHVAPFRDPHSVEQFISHKMRWCTWNKLLTLWHVERKLHYYRHSSCQLSVSRLLEEYLWATLSRNTVCSFVRLVVFCQSLVRSSEFHSLHCYCRSINAATATKTTPGIDRLVWDGSWM